MYDDAVPTEAIRTPARAGPTLRLTLNDTDVSAIALVRSRLGTASETIAARAGWWKVETMLWATVETYTCQGSIRPDTMRMARIAYITASSTWATMTWSLRSYRSAAVPAIGDRNSIGTAVRPASSPSCKGDRVRSYNSQVRATWSIHMAIEVQLWPSQRYRKSRWCTASNSGSCRIADGACSRSTSVTDAYLVSHRFRL